MKFSEAGRRGSQDCAAVTGGGREISATESRRPPNHASARQRLVWSGAASWRKRSVLAPR